MNKRFIAILSAVIALLLAPTLVASPAERPIATEQVGGTILSVAPGIAYTSAELRVSGPDGYSMDKRIAAGEPITADLLAEANYQLIANGDPAFAGGKRVLQALADGRYKYEVVFSDATGQRRAHSGLFFVESGALVSRDTVSARLGDVARDLAATSTARTGSNSSIDGPSQEAGTEDDIFTVVDATDDGTTRLGLDSDSPATSLYWGIDNVGGDLEFHEDSGFLPPGTARVTFERGGQVGIGTSTPSHALDLVDIGGGSMFELDGDNGSAFVDAHGGSCSGLCLSAGTVFQLNVTQDGIGAGPLNPESDFHLTNVDGTGDTVFKIAHAPQGSWNLGMTGTGIFTFNKNGTGGQEATFRPRQDAAGPTFEVQGSVKATNVAFPSSRALKTGFEAMDTGLVLDKVTNLPVTSWRFKTDPEDMVRFGPMAEDFHSLFEVGDGKTITVLDVQGVTLAAIQGLNAELKAEVEAKDAEIEALEARLAAIEERLATLSP